MSTHFIYTDLTLDLFCSWADVIFFYFGGQYYNYMLKADVSERSEKG